MKSSIVKFLSLSLLLSSETLMANGQNGRGGRFFDVLRPRKSTRVTFGVSKQQVLQRPENNSILGSDIKSIFSERINPNNNENIDSNSTVQSAKEISNSTTLSLRQNAAVSRPKPVATQNFKSIDISVSDSTVNSGLPQNANQVLQSDNNLSSPQEIGTNSVINNNLPSQSSASLSLQQSASQTLQLNANPILKSKVDLNSQPSAAQSSEDKIEEQDANKEVPPVDKSSDGTSEEESRVGDVLVDEPLEKKVEEQKASKEATPVDKSSDSNSKEESQGSDVPTDKPFEKKVEEQEARKEVALVDGSKQTVTSQQQVETSIKESISVETVENREGNIAEKNITGTDNVQTNDNAVTPLTKTTSLQNSSLSQNSEHQGRSQSANDQKPASNQTIEFTQQSENLKVFETILDQKLDQKKPESGTKNPATPAVGVPNAIKNPVQKASVSNAGDPIMSTAVKLDQNESASEKSEKEEIDNSKTSQFNLNEGENGSQNELKDENVRLEEVADQTTNRSATSKSSANDAELEVQTESKVSEVSESVIQPEAPKTPSVSETSPREEKDDNKGNEKAAEATKIEESKKEEKKTEKNNQQENSGSENSEVKNKNKDDLKNENIDEKKKDEDTLTSVSQSNDAEKKIASQNNQNSTEQLTDESNAKNVDVKRKLTAKTNNRKKSKKAKNKNNEQTQDKDSDQQVGSGMSTRTKTKKEGSKDLMAGKNNENSETLKTEQKDIPAKVEYKQKLKNLKKFLNDNDIKLDDDSNLTKDGQSFSVKDDENFFAQAVNIFCKDTIALTSKCDEVCKKNKNNTPEGSYIKIEGFDNLCIKNDTSVVHVFLNDDSNFLSCLSNDKQQNEKNKEVIQNLKKEIDDVFEDDSLGFEVLYQLSEVFADRCQSCLKTKFSAICQSFCESMLDVKFNNKENF